VLWTQTRHGGVAVLEYCRPPRNFLSFVAMDELRTALRAIASDDEVAVVVLASTVPGYFGAHGDLDDLAAIASGAPTQGDPLAWYGTHKRIEEMPQPVIAAIDGQAWGGGCELAMACAIRIASHRAHFAQPEIDLGIIPGSGGTVRLPRLVGYGRATELIMTGRVIDATEAASIGLVDVLFPDDDFRAVALAYAAALAAKPAAALRAAKTTLAHSIGSPARDALRNETQAFVALQHTTTATSRQRAALDRYAVTPPSSVVRLSDLAG
jgi:enoyl-CoA hydratase/carnithine racemase